MPNYKWFDKEKSFLLVGNVKGNNIEVKYQNNTLVITIKTFNLVDTLYGVLITLSVTYV